MSQAFFANEGVTIGTMDASGRFQWVEDLSALSHQELRIVENYRKQGTQRQTEHSQSSLGLPQTRQVAAE
jgi:hypothetical protein